jgi:TrmH family RNA methyltransferase
VKRNRPLNPIKWYRWLYTDKGRRETGLFPVEGERSIRQVITGNAEAIVEILAVSPVPTYYADYPIRIISEAQFCRISALKTPQGLLAIVRMPPGVYSDRLPDETGKMALLLEDIQDPGNVGTLIRTAAAFNFSGILLTDQCADPFSPKCVQSSAGTVLNVWLRRNAKHYELVKELKEKGFYIVSADLTGEEDTSRLGHHDKILLALGNEAAGLSRHVLDVSDYTYKISIEGKKSQSLNVSVSGGICMYLLSRTCMSERVY